MQMLLIVFRSSIEAEVLAALKQLGVRAFTNVPKVFGAGEAGARFGSLEWPGSNELILAALEERQSQRVVEGLKKLRDRKATRQRGAKIPLRVFVLPCLQVI